MSAQHNTTEDKSRIRALREAIDAVDAQVLTLIAKRAQLAHQIGIAKGAQGVVYRPERERSILDRVVRENRALAGRISDDGISKIYQEIIAACRAVESRPRVAYLGPRGTFTEMAAISQFGSSIDGVACATIDEVFHEAESNRCDFAVVPVENSTQGTVTRTIDLLFTTSLTIIAEVNEPIHHQLMNKTGRIEDVMSVAAHPQALDQCRQWLAAHLGDAEQKSLSSNAEAARRASEDPSLAAIAAERAAQLYDLKIVAGGIQDDPRNRTRFIVLGRAMPSYVPDVDSQTSIVFSVPNRSGALMHALLPFEKHGVSMTRLESRPARNGAWDYNFFVDLEGHCEEPHVRQAIEELRQMAGYLKVLGSYPKAVEH